MFNWVLPTRRSKIMSLDSLQSLFQEERKDMYHGEKQRLEALPRMAKAPAFPALEKAFTSHLKRPRGMSSVSSAFPRSWGDQNAASGARVWKAWSRRALTSCRKRARRP
jgi:hypothetical protein